MKGEEGAGHRFIYLPCREVVGEIHARPGCVLAAHALEVKSHGGSWTKGKPVARERSDGARNVAKVGRGINGRW